MDAVRDVRDIFSPPNTDTKQFDGGDNGELNKSEHDDASLGNNLTPSSNGHAEIERRDSRFSVVKVCCYLLIRQWTKYIYFLVTGTFPAGFFPAVFPRGFFPARSFPRRFFPRRYFPR